MNNCLICGNKISSPLSISVIFSLKTIEENQACDKCLEKFIRIDPIYSCPGCSRIQSQSYLCSDCELWKNKYPDCSLNHQALFVYNKMAKNYMKEYKFQGDLVLGKLFNKELQKILSAYQKTHLISPIPISKSSSQKRGFNQVEIILQNIEIPYKNLFVHKGEGPNQSSKSRQERLVTQQFFDLNTEYKKEILEYKKILIIDDIYTTGRTILHAKNTIHQNEELSCLEDKGSIEIKSLSLFR